MNQELLIAYTTCTEPSLNPLKMKINLELYSKSQIMLHCKHTPCKL